VKLTVPERETAALERALGSWPLRVSSELAVAEVGRAVRRYRPGAGEAVTELLSLLALRPVDRDLIGRVAVLEPRELGSLDAIHLATALALDPPPDAFVTYDLRLAAAARAHGLRVEAPA